MKVTLTFEAPDGFEKGDCENCLLIHISQVGDGVFVFKTKFKYCHITKKNYLSCKEWNCPLEIREVRTPEVVADEGWSKYDGC